MLAQHPPQLGPTLTAVAARAALLLERGERVGASARRVAHVSVGHPFAYADDHGNAVSLDGEGFARRFPGGR